MADPPACNHMPALVDTGVVTQVLLDVSWGWRGSPRRLLLVSLGSWALGLLWG